MKSLGVGEGRTAAMVDVAAASVAIVGAAKANAEMVSAAKANVEAVEAAIDVAAVVISSLESALSGKRFQSPNVTVEAGVSNACQNAAV